MMAKIPRSGGVRILYPAQPFKQAEVTANSSKSSAPLIPSSGAQTDSAPPSSPPELTPPPTSPYPYAWETWRQGVGALIKSINCLASKYVSPHQPIDAEKWKDARQALQDECQKCTEAAEAVGTAGARLAVSRALYHLQREAQAVAGQMLSSTNDLDIRDVNAVQAWLAPVRLRVEKLDLARLSLLYREVSNEFHEAVTRSQEHASVTSSPCPPPQSNERKFVLANALIERLNSEFPLKPINALTEWVQVELTRFSKRNGECRRRITRVGRNGSSWEYDEHVVLPHLQNRMLIGNR